MGELETYILTAKEKDSTLKIQFLVKQQNRLHRKISLLELEIFLNVCQKEVSLTQEQNFDNMHTQGSPERAALVWFDGIKTEGDCIDFFS